MTQGRGIEGACRRLWEGFFVKSITLLIIMLFSFSMFSLADNARLEARRDAEQDVNDTVWALTGFSVPLLIGGYYMAGVFVRSELGEIIPAESESDREVREGYQFFTKAIIETITAMTAEAPLSRCFVYSKKQNWGRLHL